MPYLRLTADRRGVEHTFLLHVAAPGEPPKVLYWYRTAPGLRLGRPALDDAAMRTIEEQHPHIDFDWPYILDVGAMTPVEVEAPLPTRKRRPRPAESEAGDGADAADHGPQSSEGRNEAATAADVEPSSDGPDLLSELLGRGIAASLRARHAELAAQVEASPAPSEVKLGWRHRLAALDPDRWAGPEAVLAGMASVDRDLETLTLEVERAGRG